MIRQRQIQCLKLLDICPYRSRKDINPERVEGTCEWFVKHNLFRDWADSARSSLLWVSADPGCGKSVLSRFLVDHVLRNDPKRVVCYFFFKEDFPDQRTAAGAICSILRQLFTLQPGLLNEQIISEFENEGARLTESFSSLFELFLRVASGRKFQLLCVLDALDECQEADRRELVAALSKFYMNPPDQFALKFIVTSRPYIQIERGFRQLETSWPTIHLRGEDDSQATKIAREIDIFTRSRVRQISVSLGLGEDETKFLETEVMRTENRTYLWVKLALDVVENILSFTKDNVEEILGSIPEGLDRLYERILNRSYDVVMARKLLHIVIAASEPMTLKQMAMALAVSEKHQKLGDIQLEPLDRFKDTLRATCGLFVTVIDDKIYFIHQTAKEFLVPNDAGQQITQPRRMEDGSKEPFLWKNTFNSVDSQSILAESCIQYLRLWYGPDNLERAREAPGLSFYPYAALYWHGHLQNSNASFKVNCSALAESFCEVICDDSFSSGQESGLYGSKHERSWFSFWLFTYFGRPLPAKPTPLIVAASCGLETVAKSILNSQCPIRCGPDECHRSPLWWAARTGQNEIVRLLLSSRPEIRATVNELQDNKTPLMVAAFYGQSSTVHTLINNCEVQLSLHDSNSMTALHHALKERHEEVAQMFLDREEIFCNATDHQLWMAFKFSIQNGYTRMSLTIARRLKPDFLRACRLSPILFTATEYLPASNSAEYPKLDLLKSIHDIGNSDPSFEDENHRSAVWWTSELPDNLDVLKWLLSELSLEPDVADRWGQTPFLRVAANNSVAKMKILLETGNININSPDHQNRTPLIHAVLTTGYSDDQQMRDAVSLLLSNNANTDVQDTDGRTALMHASEAGYQDVVNLLIDHGASLDLKDDFGQTALMLAREVNRYNMDPDDIDFETRWVSSSLHSNEGSVHARIVNRLVKAGAEDGGKTPKG
ncbi:Vegetative incompatibility protein HET-E-1 [Colletotrichum gloeosporioides]|uniref:Vegetative incompatibility protein HET-E-1 n=1 Tax=Colletotrichum gloeosporioides TaxID=474922 RepID=A0A8H4CDX2_COLGL|nr:Vegetative incompatibility protein HET-E-1 [Colletotrichum gloeosporioides]KAF3801897.1 Vegetative incompatibility protein HET-E-1 [Colletotrichum gloeosporioides]